MNRGLTNVVTIWPHGSIPLRNSLLQLTFALINSIRQPLLVPLATFFPVSAAVAAFAITVHFCLKISTGGIERGLCLFNPVRHNGKPHCRITIGMACSIYLPASGQPLVGVPLGLHQKASHVAIGNVLIGVDIKLACLTLDPVITDNPQH